MARRPAFSWTATIVALCLAGCGGEGSERPTVRVALDFTPNAAHAPIFAAASNPSDGDARIAIRQPSSSTDSLKLLATGRADLAVLDIHDLGLARERGEDLVGVGVLVNRPLAAVIARPDVRRPRDLEGRRVGVTGLPSDDAVLRAVVEGDGGDFDRVKRVTIGFTAVPSLVAEKVDAVTAFWNVEGVTLRRRGVKTREFRVGGGARRYPELVFVTTRAKLRAERERLTSAMTGIAGGAGRALSGPEPVIAAVARAGETNPALVRAELTAIRSALRTVPRVPPNVLRNWARFDVRYGILERPPDLKRAFEPLVPY
ncbi:MAG TPA: ABC transporter substrate-binding protein [Thermoleophilaceae bacterium]|nr:ABC transporter substrate-binding protein [Thermoleophilaceae bacterium]